MLTPDEKQALIEFAGPIFALGKDIDSMYFNDQQTKTDGMRDGGISGAIKNALERDFRASQVQQPQYIQPPPPVQPQFQAVPQQYIQQEVLPQTDPNQLELKFDKSEQEKTNDLLRNQNKILQDLNKKIERILALLTQDDSEDNS